MTSAPWRVHQSSGRQHESECPEPSGHLLIAAEVVRQRTFVGMLETTSGPFGMRHAKIALLPARRRRS